MWVQVLFVCGCTLFSWNLAENQGAFTQRHDDKGQCQYIFTVSSPEGSGSCPGVLMERDRLLSRLTLLEALVSRLVGDTNGQSNGERGLQEAYTQVTGERDQLQQDKERLTKQIQELQRRLSKTSLEVESLRLKPCQPHTGHRPNTGSVNSVSTNAYQEMRAEVTEVPASHLLPERNQTFNKGCGELVTVGEPISHKKAESITGKYGVWLQDPEPQGTLYSNKTVWRIDAVGKDIRQLFAYEDMNQFSRGFPMKVLMLPEPVESTGATVYRGSLYYQRRQSRTIIRYDLTSESLVNQQDLPNASFHGQHPYSWGGRTDIDLAVDEQGLWAIYSTHEAKGAIMISKLDPESLEVRQSWETSIRKNTVANAFMMCGRLYTVGSYTAPNTTINYMFDTATNVGKAIAIPFINKYRYNSMVDYNHALRKLFAWDNFNMVTYDIRLLERSGQTTS
ncbi:myocilin-like [Periophthalmus magnuspinnatus]|uniref:myocilin-like n=1 Tax=Periophthalmus magnuspinnatus TaxID=409849 RepID=UPI002436B9E4|nr:myocilin-like [Periophthalmus magnuspinnatus]